MTDVNEQSFAAGTNGDSASMHVSRSKPTRAAKPLWRFKPALPPVNVVRKFKTEIIPKIVMALRSPPKPVEITDGDSAKAVQFAAVVIGSSDDAPFDFVDNLLMQGMTVEAVFLHLLTPTARHLGAMWEADTTDFANVTLGVSRMQRILRKLGESFLTEQDRETGGESALLTVIPGEQHSFGLSIVAEFFRRSGWNLCTGPFLSHRELTSLLQNQWFDIVGFSVCSDRRLNELRKDIDDIRRDSRNRHVGIMLGGPMLISHPELVTSLGADMMSIDAATAPQQARNLITEKTANANVQGDR